MQRGESDAVVVVTLRELDALHELPHLAQVLYLRGLRPHMDVATGQVGMIRRLSERGLIEVATVPAVPGRSAAHVVAPTRKAIRSALDALESAGLVRRVQGVDRCFVFYLPKARQDKSVRRSRGQIRGQDQEGQKPHGNAGFSPADDGIRGLSRGPHQGSRYIPTVMASFEVTESAREEAARFDLPAGTSMDAWRLYADHWRAQRKWSISRAKQCAGHLRIIAAEGGNPDDVLDWALARSLADLRDAWRRMQADAAREQRFDRHDGESLANRAVRKMREGHSRLRVIDGGALLGGPGDD